MAETENGQVAAPPNKQAELLQELLAEVRLLRAGLAVAVEEFARYKPILDAYLRPNGPVGWAVARQQKKAEQRRAEHGPD